MTTYPYVPNTPLASNKPSVDQPDMLTNTSSIPKLIATDHISFGTASGSQIDGMHKVIQQVTGIGTQNLLRSGAAATYTNAPAAIATINQVIAGQYTPDTTGGTADTQLFTKTAGNVISQLTGFSVGDLEDGWQWVGGVLIQWGRKSLTFAGGVASATVVFKDRVAGAIPFPNNCFIVVPNLQYGSAGAPTVEGSISVDRSTISNTSFAVTAVTTSIRYAGFYWFAVGN